MVIGLNEIHENNILHKEIKSENIFISFRKNE